MRKITQLNIEFDEIKANYKMAMKKKYPNKDYISLDMDCKQGKRITFLKQCIEYLSTNPSVDFIEREIARLDNKLSIIMKQQPPMTYFQENPKNTLKSFQGLELGAKKIREQLKTLNFILNEQD